MAENEEDPSVEERVDRSVRRLLVKIGIVLMLVAVGVGWASIGFPGAAPRCARRSFTCTFQCNSPKDSLPREQRVFGSTDAV